MTSDALTAGPIPYPLKFQIGARTLWKVGRRLIRIGYDLPAVIALQQPVLPPLGEADGYVLTSVPEAVATRLPGFLVQVRQHYMRNYADFAAGFDAYMAHFASKSRNSLMRKRKRFGEIVDVRRYRTPDEIRAFVPQALAVSRMSYQHRLLDAGLPEGDKALADMVALAGSDLVQAFLLFRDGRAVAYLYLPVENDVLIYAYLGYDPAEAELSPGTVLQLEAIRMLAEEGRYTRLDFTEGEGQHKRLFATDGVPCLDLLLLRPTLANRALLSALGRFDALIARGKALSGHRAFGWLRKLRR